MSGQPAEHACRGGTDDGADMDVVVDIGIMGERTAVWRRIFVARLESYIRSYLHWLGCRHFFINCIREVDMHNQFNFNIIEKLNGKFKHRIKTTKGFNLVPDGTADHRSEGGCLALICMLIICYNFFWPHRSLDSRTPAEAEEITICGKDKWITWYAT